MGKIWRSVHRRRGSTWCLWVRASGCILPDSDLNWLDTGLPEGCYSEQHNLCSGSSHCWAETSSLFPDRLPTWPYPVWLFHSWNPIKYGKLCERTCFCKHGDQLMKNWIFAVILKSHLSSTYFTRILCRLLNFLKNFLLVHCRLILKIVTSIDPIF